MKFTHSGASTRSWAALAAALSFALPMFLGHQALANPTPATGQVVGYYEVYNGPKAIAQVPWQALTRLNVAFLGIQGGGTAAWLLPDGSNMPELTGESVKTVRALVAAREQNNPDVKLVLSVGGASMSNRFSEAASTAEGRQALAASAVRIAKALGLDGVDYDWEYPGRLQQNNCEYGKKKCERAEDYENFTGLLAATRELQAPGQLLTVAVYVDPSAAGVPYDVAGMDPLLDAWNVMGYDMAAPNWVKQTAFPAAIAATTHSLDAYARLGATPAKLVLGVPLYGYIWRNVPFAGVDAWPTAVQGSKAGRPISINNLLDRYTDRDGCALYPTNDGDFFYCSYGDLAGEWSPVDSVRVLQLKGAYVRDGGFGGLMSWSVSMDTPAQLMANAMAQSLR